MVRAKGRRRAARLIAPLLLALAACIPGTLTLQAGDASTGDDGGPLSTDGGAESGSSSGGDAHPTGDARSSDVGAVEAGGDVLAPADTGSTADTGLADTGGPADTGPADTGSPPGCACLPPPPGGWNFVALYVTARSSCPTGYAMPSDVIINPSHLGPPTCGCTCSSTAPSCTSGTFQLAYGSASNACTSTVAPVAAADGACVPGSFPFAAADHQVDAAPPTGGACSPNPTVTPPSPGGNLGKACAFTGALGSGCSGNLVCAPAVAPPYQVCIEQAGPQTCPSAYPTSYATGTGLDPGVCTSCTCAAQLTCSGASLSVFTDNACQTLGVSVAADGVCTDTPNGVAGNSYQYSATGNASCTPSMPTPTASSSLTGLMTVCCP